MLACVRVHDEKSGGTDRHTYLYIPDPSGGAFRPGLRGEPSGGVEGLSKGQRKWNTMDIVEVSVPFSSAELLNPGRRLRPALRTLWTSVVVCRRGPRPPAVISSGFGRVLGRGVQWFLIVVCAAGHGRNSFQGKLCAAATRSHVPPASGHTKHYSGETQLVDLRRLPQMPRSTILLPSSSLSSSSWGPPQEKNDSGRREQW
eukprot:1539510-Pyramimonas_sp.AAC.1